MARKSSAGLLMYRNTGSGLEVFLIHPGGPFWARKDKGAWSIPKGELETGEDPLTAARREFQEETGLLPQGPLTSLGVSRQGGGKAVHAFAVEGDCNVEEVASNTFEMEWPPRSGKIRRFPEIDRAAWFPISVACEKINPGQVAFLEALESNLRASDKRQGG